MVVSDRRLCMYEKSCIGIRILKTSFQDILQADAQAEGIIPEPTFLHCKTKIVRRRRHSEVQIIALGPDVHVRLQLPAASETESVIQGKEEHRS